MARETTSGHRIKTENLTVRQAVVDDMPTILTMIDEAAEWLGTKGTDQWARPWPNRASRDRRIWRGLKGDKTWMVEQDGLPVATVTLRRHGNGKLWTWEERRERAAYLSRLIVRRDYGGQAIGEALIDWAGIRASRVWRAQWIRIDVWTTNVALHNYYEKRGFRSYGDQRPAKINNYPSAALFQKPLAEVDEKAAARFAEGSALGDRGASRTFRIIRSSVPPQPDQTCEHDRHPEAEIPGLPAADRAADWELAREVSAG